MSWGLKLSRGHYDERKNPMGGPGKMRKRTLTNQERREGRKRGRSNFQIRMAKACNQVMEEIQENPPGLICWLKGGVNLSRAEKIRKDLERG